MKKKFKNTIICFVSLISVFFLFGAQEKSQETPFPFANSMAEPFRFEGIHIYAKAYTPNESTAYLHRNLLVQGIQPIQISVQNNTQKTYVLTNQGIDLPTQTTNQVAAKVSQTAIPRFIFFKVIGFLFWPFLIPGTVDSIYTMHSHFKMKKEFHAKTIKDHGEILSPYSCIHRVVFVSKEKTTSVFDVYLQEQKSNHFYPFQVKINS